MLCCMCWHPTPPDGTLGLGLQDTVDASAVDRLPVAKEQHRMLIGPRGSTIQDLERESGARLSFEGLLVVAACSGTSLHAGVPRGMLPGIEGFAHLVKT